MKAIFETHLSIQECKERLKISTDRRLKFFGKKSVLRQYLWGKRFELRCRIDKNNDFAPVFRGKFYETHNGTKIQGRVGRTPRTKYFLGGFMGFSACIVVTAIFSGENSVTDIALGSLFFIAGLLFFLAGSKPDHEEYLIDFIEKTLDAHRT